ncbi:GFA family protein [Reyranella sp.]|uniref:GFA family protein n=1 Tax=Reyranella sp. TaxID=1929291 RepID=UPI003BACDAFD
MVRATAGAEGRRGPGMATGQCLCGKVAVEIGVPARWAWHDHSRVSRRAHGAAYATYVGCWRSRFRLARGARSLVRFEDPATGDVRAFCGGCGTPVFYARKRSPQMVNVPRALLDAGTGREPLYHVNIEDQPEWAYRGEPLKPLKGFPGVLWTGPRRRKRTVVR